MTYMQKKSLFPHHSPRLQLTINDSAVLEPSFLLQYLLFFFFWLFSNTLVCQNYFLQFAVYWYYMYKLCRNVTIFTTAKGTTNGGNTRRLEKCGNIDYKKKKPKLVNEYQSESKEIVWKTLTEVLDSLERKRNSQERNRYNKRKNIAN